MKKILLGLFLAVGFSGGLFATEIEKPVKVDLKVETSTVTSKEIDKEAFGSCYHQTETNYVDNCGNLQNVTYSPLVPISCPEGTPENYVFKTPVSVVIITGVKCQTIPDFT